MSYTPSELPEILKRINKYKDKIDDLDEDDKLTLTIELDKLNHLKDNNPKLFVEPNFYKKQDDFVNEVYNRMLNRKGPKVFALLGGNRSGKSISGTLATLKCMENISNLRIWMATYSDQSIKCQQLHMWNWVDKQRISYGHYNVYNGFNKRTMELDNGSIAYFKTYEQGSDTFQSDSLDIVLLDEEPNWAIFQECLARTMDRNGIIIFTFTSLQGFTRLVDFLYSDNDYVDLRSITMLDNPYVDEEAKKAFLSIVDEDEKQSRVYGQVSVKEGLVYKEFNRSVHVIEPFDYKTKVKNDPIRYKIYECIDPHTRTPHHWLRTVHDTSNDILYIVDDLKAPQESMLIKDFSELIKVHRDGIKPTMCDIDTSSMTPDVIRTPDNDDDAETSENVRQEFFKHGIQTTLCLKDTSIGIQSVKARLKFYKEDNKVTQEPKLYVFNTCSVYLYEVQRYSWASQSERVGESRDIPNQVKKKDDHAQDCLKYICLRLLTTMSGKPLTYFKDISNMYKVD